MEISTILYYIANLRRAVVIPIPLIKIIKRLNKAKCNRAGVIFIINGGIRIIRNPAHAFLMPAL